MPSPLVRRWLRNTFWLLVIVAAYVIAYRGSEVNFARLFTSLPKGGPLLRAFLTPDLFRRDIEPVTLQLALPVPCDSAPPGAGARQRPAAGAQRAVRRPAPDL